MFPTCSNHLRFAQPSHVSISFTYRSPQCLLMLLLQWILNEAKAQLQQLKCEKKSSGKTKKIYSEKSSSSIQTVCDTCRTVGPATRSNRILSGRRWFSYLCCSVCHRWTIFRPKPSKTVRCSVLKNRDQK